MWYVFLCTVLCVISLLGLTYIFENLWLVLLRPKSDPPHTEIIYLKKEVCIQQLRSAIENLRWEGNHRINSLILVDLGISKTEKKEILKIIENKNIFFAENSFNDYLVELFGNDEKF